MVKVSKELYLNLLDHPRRIKTLLEFVSLESKIVLEQCCNMRYFFIYNSVKMFRVSKDWLYFKLLDHPGGIVALLECPWRAKRIKAFKVLSRSAPRNSQARNITIARILKSCPKNFAVLLPSKSAY
jgi:hypothetical protein